MIDKTNRALHSLCPGSEWVVRNGTITWLKENGHTQPSQSQIDAEISRLDSLDVSDKYKTDRNSAYPSIKDQLDQIYWDKKNGTNKWVEAIDKVKSDNPKP